MIGVLIAKKNVSSAFDALNRRDVSAFLSSWRDDCVFIYPGNIPVSGKMEGKSSIEKWFQNFMDQFPKFKFTLKSICVKNIFDFVGTNVVTAHWDIDLTNRDGNVVHNNGVTIINIKFGKAFLVTDYYFDTGDKFRTAWSVT
jgi:ketosteroid isomerase-like protein